MSDIELSPKQREAVQAEGPVLVTGPAGSGKTEVILQRIRKKGSGYFILTHTRAAAQHLRDRLRISRAHKAVYSIHGACASEIREWKGIRGFEDGLNLKDRKASVNMIYRIAGKLNVDTDVYDPRHIASYISYIKNHKHSGMLYQINQNYTIEVPQDFADKLITLQQSSTEISGFASKCRWPKDWKSVLVKVIYEYQEKLAGQEAFDYDDQLLAVHFRILKHEEGDFGDAGNNQIFQNRGADTLYVDDIQDFNWLQYEICKRWVRETPNLFVTSDPNYNIYKFRSGGNTTSQIKLDIPALRIIDLEDQSYRSTEEIQKLSNSLTDTIFGYPQRVAVHKPSSTFLNKAVSIIDRSNAIRYSHFEQDYSPLVTHESSNDHTQAEEITNMISNMIASSSSEESRSGSLQPEEIAILYLQFKQIERILPFLRRKDIPHTFYGSSTNEGWPSQVRWDLSRDLGVRLCSLHQSKGIEVKLVFILGLEDPGLEHSFDSSDYFVQSLLHIGINRAVDKILLCWCESRNGLVYTDKRWFDRIRVSWLEELAKEIVPARDVISKLNKERSHHKSEISRLENEKKNIESQLNKFKKEAIIYRDRADGLSQKVKELEMEVLGYERNTERLHERLERFQEAIKESKSVLDIRQIPYRIKVRRVNHEVGTVIAKHTDRVTVQLENGQTDVWLVKHLQKVIE